MCRILLAIIFFAPAIVFSQDGDFKFGGTYRDFELKSPDTTAVALVLDEFGKARFDNSGDYNLLVDYHVKIKILKPDGLRYGTISVGLNKYGMRTESLRSVKAQSYRIVNNRIETTTLDPKTIMTDNVNKELAVKRFVIPSVTVGTIIEYSYTFETPFYFNFFTWTFQEDIPKLKSEYVAYLPANYVYNISLRGFLNLDKNESEVMRDCFQPGAYRSDCSKLTWGMKNIPAFVEEEYMTAAKNYISCIRFELSEYHAFDGTKKKITREWKDVANELKLHENFGVELKKVRGVVKEHIDPLLAGETDDLGKAQKIYTFVRDWFFWNGEKSKYSIDGVKKSFESKKGSAGDINLILIGALKYAGLNVDPLILSTRDNGAVNNLYPVIADFNYVVAKLNIGDKVYLLDATDQFAPFASLPERCLNGQGRVLTEDEANTYWYDLKATDKKKRVTVGNFRIAADGTMKGTLQISAFGYSAIDTRKDIYNAGGEKDYAHALETGWPKVTTLKSEISNYEDRMKPLILKADIEATVFDGKQTTFLFDPNITSEWESNPFKSTDRLYPVDFGATLDETVILNFEFPEGYKIEDKQSKIALVLPNNGGRFIYDIVPGEGNKVSVNAALVVSRPLFSSEEYHYLREMFNRVVAAFDREIVFVKK